MLNSVNQMLLVVTLGVSILCASHASATDLVGSVRVIDGDTIDVGTARVRLHGLDAPEQGQHCGAGGSGHWACGAWVTENLRQMVDGRMARCVELDRDRYDRIVARCFVDGEDVGEQMVSRGFAVAFTRYSMDYTMHETAAREAGLGLHAVAFDPPAQYRKRSAQKATKSAQKECVIKGNISRNGAERIYHMPGQRDYKATRINLSKGERCFDTAEDARLAGWRPAKR